MRILVGDTLIADTLNGIELCERGYPLRPDLKEELSRADVDMSQLLVPSTVTHSPFKGDTTPDIANVDWSDEQSI